MNFTRPLYASLIAISLCIPNFALANETEDRDDLLKEHMIVSGITSTVFWTGLLTAVAVQARSEKASPEGLQMATFGKSPWNSAAFGFLALAGLAGVVDYAASITAGTIFWAEHGSDIDDIDIRYHDMSNSYFVDVTGTALAIAGGVASKCATGRLSTTGTYTALAGGGLLLMKRFLDVRNFWAWIAD